MVSDSPRLVDFAVGLVDFTLNLPNGQVKVLWEIVFEYIRASWKIELLCTLLRLIAPKEGKKFKLIQSCLIILLDFF